MYKLRPVLAFVFVISALSISASNVSARARSGEDVKKDMIKAVATAVSTYQETGMIGLAADVEDCYETKSNKFYCLYLDLASRRIDQDVVEEMHYPPDEFFADEKFAGRVRPILVKANMDMSTANRYLATITPVINSLVEKVIIGKQ